MFDERFSPFAVPTPGGVVAGVVGGSGPPLLLLHGIPETHAMWRFLAPRLADEYTVVATDLRGYGGSRPAARDTEVADHAMRSLARDQLAAMRQLGWGSFGVVGHDRGARCAYRLALDHPAAIDALAVLDVIPTTEVFARVDGRSMLEFWVWSFLAAAEPVPEALIAGAPDVLVDHMIDAWSDDASAFSPELRALYRAPFHDPELVHAICQQYRAAATVDVAADDADRGVRFIRAPMLVLWSATGALSSGTDPVHIWRAWATDVRGAPIPAGHFLAEEAPDATLEHLLPFLREAVHRSGGG